MRIRNAEYDKQYRKKYYYSHLSQEKKYRDEYRNSHLDYFKNHHKEYNKSHRSELNDYSREWRKNNPEKQRLIDKAHTYTRRSVGYINKSIIKEVYDSNVKKYGILTCYLCLNPILFEQDQLEHKIPISRGGTNMKDNLDIACKKCNNTKKTKTHMEFLKERQNA